MVDVFEREHGAEERSVIACDEEHKKQVGIHYIDDQTVRKKDETKRSECGEELQEEEGKSGVPL